MKLKELPEKWYIKITNENVKLLGNWRDAGELGRAIDGYCVSEYNRNIGYYFSSLTDIKEYKEITAEDFKRLVLKIKETKEVKKKIVGYKCPVDLWDGITVKEGCIFKVGEEKLNYYPENNLGDIAFALPKQLVETWEPVYEEEYKVGDWVITEGYCNEYDGKPLKITKIFKNYEREYANFEGGGTKNFAFPKRILRKATEEEIEAAQEITLGDYKVEILSKSKFKVGCTEYSKADLDCAIQTLNLTNIKNLTFNDGTIVTLIDAGRILNKWNSWKK